MDCRPTGQARRGAKLAPPHETAFSSTGRGGKVNDEHFWGYFSSTGRWESVFRAQAALSPMACRRGASADISTRRSFLRRAGEKLISSARQHHYTFFSSTGRGTSPSGALFLGRQGGKSIASAQQETFLDRQEGKCVSGAASARRQ